MKPWEISTAINFCKTLLKSPGKIDIILINKKYADGNDILDVTSTHEQILMCSFY